jgi:hypothetical protein
MEVSQGIPNERTTQSNESMKTIEVKYPRTIQECTPSMLCKWIHLSPVWQELQEDFSGMLDFHVQVVSIFTGLKMTEVKQVALDDVIKASYTLLGMVSQHKMAEPTGKVEIDGKVYVFQKDFSKISTGQMIDMKLIENVTEEPAKALAVCYIEEGMEYCEKDDAGMIQNPNDLREKLFRDKFPGDEFLNFFGFFLTEYEQRKLAILGIQTLRMIHQRNQILRDVSKTVSGLSGPESFYESLKNLVGKWTI